jgi:hypothetical protein
LVNPLAGKCTFKRTFPFFQEKFMSDTLSVLKTLTPVSESENIAIRQFPHPPALIPAAPGSEAENLVNTSRPFPDPKSSLPIFSTHLKYKGFPTPQPCRPDTFPRNSRLNFRCSQYFSPCWAKISKMKI